MTAPDGAGRRSQTEDADIFAGLTFAEDFAAEALKLPRPADRSVPDADRDGQKWRGPDPRLPDQVAVRLNRHLAQGRTRARVAAKRGDASGLAAAQRRIEVATRGLGLTSGTWWSRTSSEATSLAQDALAELDAAWGSG
ncbi:MAG: hypothetical protein IPL37_04650 [Austwickia sp.]|jgi:hypothetical protein|nr:hypothetical protein [Austwickia sp.]